MLGLFSLYLSRLWLFLKSEKYVGGVTKVNKIKSTKNIYHFLSLVRENTMEKKKINPKCYNSSFDRDSWINNSKLKIFRVGALAWNGDMLSSGSRDRQIFQRDIRTPSQVPERRLVGHRQEVCGLKWSPDNQCLARYGRERFLPPNN